MRRLISGSDRVVSALSLHFNRTEWTGMAFNGMIGYAKNSISEEEPCPSQLYVYLPS
jgi:hypothetical protein